MLRFEDVSSPLFIYSFISPRPLPPSLREMRLCFNSMAAIFLLLFFFFFFFFFFFLFLHNGAILFYFRSCRCGFIPEASGCCRMSWRMCLSPYNEISNLFLNKWFPPLSTSGIHGNGNPFQYFLQTRQVKRRWRRIQIINAGIFLLKMKKKKMAAAAAAAAAVGNQ